MMDMTTRILDFKNPFQTKNSSKKNELIATTLQRTLDEAAYSEWSQSITDRVNKLFNRPKSPLFFLETECEHLYLWIPTVQQETINAIVFQSFYNLTYALLQKLPQNAKLYQKLAVLRQDPLTYALLQKLPQNAKLYQKLAVLRQDPESPWMNTIIFNQKFRPNIAPTSSTSNRDRDLPPTPDADLKSFKTILNCLDEKSINIYLNELTPDELNHALGTAAKYGHLQMVEAIIDKNNNNKEQQPFITFNTFKVALLNATDKFHFKNYCQIMEALITQLPYEKLSIEESQDKTTIQQELKDTIIKYYLLTIKENYEKSNTIAKKITKEGIKGFEVELLEKILSIAIENKNLKLIKLISKARNFSQILNSNVLIEAFQLALENGDNTVKTLFVNSSNIAFLGKAIIIAAREGVNLNTHLNTKFRHSESTDSSQITLRVNIITRYFPEAIRVAAASEHDDLVEQLIDYATENSWKKNEPNLRLWADIGKRERDSYLPSFLIIALMHLKYWIFFQWYNSEKDKPVAETVGK